MTNQSDPFERHASHGEDDLCLGCLHSAKLFRVRTGEPCVNGDQRCFPVGSHDDPFVCVPDRRPVPSASGFHLPPYQFVIGAESSL
jgi:hypothetical protein